MPLDFPTSPTNGQIFGQYVYDSSLPGWRNANTSEAIGNQYKAGLTPIIPASINVTGGSATTNSQGMVTYTAASSVTLNNVFSSTYKNYKILVSCAASAGCEIAIRFSSDGTPNSGASYKAGGWRYASNVTDNYSMGSGSYAPLGLINSAQANNFTASFDIFNPMLTGNTNYVGSSVGYGGTYATALSYNGFFLADNTFNGLYLWPTAGNFTGSIQIYGYR